MKVSSKGHYGLLALAELVENYKLRRAVQVKEIARNKQIPPEYLGQIMVLLKRGRLVHGSRGPAGGYVLARPPETITVREVLHVLEGPLVGIDFETRHPWSSHVSRDAAIGRNLGPGSQSDGKHFRGNDTG